MTLLIQRSDGSTHPLPRAVLTVSNNEAWAEPL